MSRQALYVSVFLTQEESVLTTETVLMRASNESDAREQVLEEFPEVVHVVSIRMAKHEELKRHDEGHPFTPTDEDRIAIAKYCTDNRVLVAYIVTYVEIGYLTPEHFRCFAENEAHATEQAFDAYPDIDYIVGVKMSTKEDECDA